MKGPFDLADDDYFFASAGYVARTTFRLGPSRKELIDLGQDWRGSVAENNFFPNNANHKLGKIYYYANIK